MKISVDIGGVTVYATIIEYGLRTIKLKDGRLADMWVTNQGNFVNIDGRWQRLPNRHSYYWDAQQSGVCGCWACHLGLPVQ